MKMIKLQTNEVYRMLTPKWAYLPCSGVGAGQFGGRVNRIGVDALYSSLEMETASINLANKIAKT